MHIFKGAVRDQQTFTHKLFFCSYIYRKKRKGCGGCWGSVLDRVISEGHFDRMMAELRAEGWGKLPPKESKEGRTFLRKHKCPEGMGRLMWGNPEYQRSYRGEMKPLMGSCHKDRDMEETMSVSETYTHRKALDLCANAH